MSQKSKTNTNNKNKHEPVLLQQVLDILNPKRGEKYLDLTAGYGGHSTKILDLTKSNCVLVDRDINAINDLHAKFGNLQNISYIHDSFLSACRKLKDENQKFDLILVDLGISSPHIDNATRGFSFANEGPLDMRMNQEQDLTAEQVVNSYSADDLTRIIRDYGEDPKAKRIANLIVEARPIKNTVELANIAKKAWPIYSKSHPATRLFQAIRIEVNDELSQIEQSLPIMTELLNEGGRLAIITFHSIEDRIVKLYFNEIAGERYDTEFQLLTKRPITATQQELDFNPRARSAKLRAVAKINIKKKG